MQDSKGSLEAGSKHHKKWNPRQGGFRASLFIFVMVGLENMGFVANMSSMVLYFISVMHFDVSTSSNTLTNFMGTTFLLSMIGGFISDTYLTRLNTVLIFGTIEVIGLMLITIQAHYKSLQPEFCGETASRCIKGGQAFMFYSSLGLLALGSGGVRGALPSLGGDQFDQKDPKERKYLASYFNWLLLSITIGASIGVTIIVWVSSNKGWDLGFFISTLAAFIGFTVVAIGKPFYRFRIPGESPLLRLLQVMVVAFRNRNLSLPEHSDELHEIHYEEATHEEERIPHTNQFRFFDKAAILPQGSKSPKPGRVCTVTQVEEFKILTRMMPIVASTILMNTCLAQLNTFSIQQGNKMNLYLGSFLVPAASIPVIPLVFMSILIPIYEFAFVPFARRFTGRPNGITHLQRVGVGLVLSAISMSIAGIVEVKRRNTFNNDNGMKISLFWLSFQFAIFGIADMFTLVGLMEFFYSEAPAGMRSLSTSFTFLTLSLGYFLSSVFVDVTNAITMRVTESKQGWLHGQNLNKNNLNLFYWFLAILSVLNFGNYLFWASWYKYKEEAPLSEESEKDLNGSPLLKEEEKGSPKQEVISSPTVVEKEVTPMQKVLSSPSSPKSGTKEGDEQEEEDQAVVEKEVIVHQGLVGR